MATTYVLGVVMHRHSQLERSEGFTLLELMLGLILSAFVLTGIYSIYGTCQSTQSSGVDMADAQQNARIALDVLETDLRHAGCGIPGHIQTPIVVASQYRVTFVRDKDDDGSLDLGETITYFLDQDTNNFIAAVTPNPRDMVVRRVASDSLNPNADPITGFGEVVASNITQQVDDDGQLDVPMFRYFDVHGNPLVDFGSTDPYSGMFGYTVSDSVLLGLPLGGPNKSTISKIQIAVLAEGEAKDNYLKDYRRILLSTTISPRNLPANLP